MKHIILNKKLQWRNEMKILKKYIQVIGIWILIIPLAILNGGLRENVLNKLGDVALPLSGIILSMCIFFVAYLLIPKIKNCKLKDYIIFGIIWFVLTNLFDLFMYMSEGRNFDALLNSYNFTKGNLWILVVITALLSPIMVSKINKLNKEGEKNV